MFVLLLLLQVHFAGMFAFGLLKNCFWAFIFYLQQTAPEVIDHLSWVWPPIGAWYNNLPMHTHQHVSSLTHTRTHTPSTAPAL